MTLLTHNSKSMTNDLELKVMRPGLWMLKGVIRRLTSTAWREKVLAGERRAARISLAEGPVEVDHRLAAIIESLNASGIHTAWSCQGSGWRELLLSKAGCSEHAEHAYIKLVPGQVFPVDLLSAARASGCFLLVVDPVDGHHLVAHYAIPSAYAPAGNESFRRLFADYLQRRLDPTGDRYRRHLPEAMVTHLLGRYAFEARLKDIEPNHSQTGVGQAHT